MEVGRQSGRLSGDQYSSTLLDTEHSVLTEHVDVVHRAQLTSVQSASDVRQLDADDVVGRRVRRAASASPTALAAGVAGQPASNQITIIIIIIAMTMFMVLSS